jgi:hypothetical protein
MSSCINDRRHFDCIAAGIKKMLWSQNFHPSRKVTKHLPGVALHSQDADMMRVDELTQMLADIQIESVCRQYPSGRGVEVDIADQRQIMKIPSRNPKALTPVALFKAIGCAHYQIEEWRIEKVRPITTEETDCLAFFEVFRAELAAYIVTRLPEYEKAEWDITQ